MNKRITATSALLLMGLSTPSLANDWYVGANASKQEVKAQIFPEKDFSTLGLIAGYHVNQYVSLEARYQSGVKDYEEDVMTLEGEGSYTLEIDRQINLLVKASYPIYQHVHIFALAGYSDTTITDTLKTKTQNPASPIKETFDGFTYGLGVSYQFDPRVSVAIEYQILPDYKVGVIINDGLQTVSQDWSSLNLGFTYTF